MKNENCADEDLRIQVDHEDAAPDPAVTPPIDRAEQTSSADNSEAPTGQAGCGRTDKPQNGGAEVDQGNRSARPASKDTVCSDHDADQGLNAHAAGPSVAVLDAKARMAAESRRGPDRPLAVLSRSERDLHAHSAALARLSPADRARPDKNLLVSQLVSSVDRPSTGGWREKQLRSEVLALHSALEAEDATDSNSDPPDRCQLMQRDGLA